MPGKVCQRSPHHGFSEDGICKWCDDGMGRSFSGVVKTGKIDPASIGTAFTIPDLEFSILELSPIKIPGTPLVILHEQTMALPEELARFMLQFGPMDEFLLPPSEHEADEDPK